MTIKHAIGPMAGEGARLAPTSPQAATRMLMRRNDVATADLAEHLAWAGVRFLILKGPSVRAVLYADDETRASNDIDVLVHPTDQRRCATVLASRGYRRGPLSPHSTPWHSATETPVDVHVTLPRATASPRTVFHLLHQSSRLLLVDGRQVPVLSNSALAAHLAIHLTQPGDQRPREDFQRAVATLDHTTWIGAASIAASIGTLTSLGWALDEVRGGAALRQSLDVPAVPRRQIPVRSYGEAGVRAFLRSPVHWRERLRSMARVRSRWSSVLRRATAPSRCRRPNGAAAYRPPG